MNETAFGPGEIGTLVNLGVTIIVAIINLHQSWRWNHLQSECFGHRVVTCDTAMDSPRVVVSKD